MDHAKKLINLLVMHEANFHGGMMRSLSKLV